MLDVRRLRVLREVARAGSLARAADALDYSASAISQQIATLEREVGSVLLERGARGVVLTEAGRVLVAHAETILADIEAAEAALTDLKRSKGGQLRLGAFPTVAAALLPPAVGAFRSRLPRVLLQVKDVDPGACVALLREGRLDLALTLDLTPASSDGIAVFDLFTDPVQLALHRSHRLAGRSRLDLADLTGERWIDVPRANSGGNLLRRACERAGFVPEVAFESDDYAVIGELVGAGVGIALLPDLARRPREDVVLVPLGPGAPRRRIQAATRSASVRSPAASTMLEILLAQTRAARAGAAQAASGSPPRR